MRYRSCTQIKTAPVAVAERRGLKRGIKDDCYYGEPEGYPGNDSNLLIVFYVQIMPDDFVMQPHRF